MNAPPLLLKTEDRLLVVFCHLSIFLGVGLLLPLVVYLVKKDSPVVTYHAREALNCHLSLLIYSLASLLLVLVVVGAFLLIGIWVAAMIFAVIAAVRGADGIEYQYPLIFRFIR